jgi:hypothetical protein
MTKNTYESRQSAFKPLFGAVAVAATVATLGLAVVGPAALAPSAGEPSQLARTNARPVEVAILPGTINVIAKRTKAARADSPYLPASYKVR